MLLPPALLGLPTSLLLLVATHVQAQQLPTAVKKMSLDEGEKILPHYLAFSSELSPAQSPMQARGILIPEEELLLSVNSSATLDFRPPFVLHYTQQTTPNLDRERGVFRRAKEALARLSRRQAACPTGSHDCSNINKSDLCCEDGQTCFEVDNSPDTGNAGCCTNGQTCSGAVGPCNSSKGDTACPAAVGGGCCVSGFVCASVGCVASSFIVITQTRTSTSTSVISTGASPTTAVTTVIVTVTTTSSAGGGGGGGGTTSSATQIMTTTASGTSGPTASDTTSTLTATTTTASQDAGSPPYRPTSGSSSVSTADDFCPTGFYACSARAEGGCCRTGRDCQTTSCPPISSTTITTNGATVVVGGEVPTTTVSSRCAGGWFLCGSDAGPVAGCCPTAYACGTASCTLSTSSATATVAKKLPNLGERTRALATSVLVGLAGFLSGVVVWAI